MMTNEHITVASNSYEKVKTLKFSRTLLTSQNSIHEEITFRLKVEYLCYYSDQTLLSSQLLSKNLKTKIYKTTIYPFVLYGCETLREECRLRVFENRILRRIFWP
jgi:hypothetical protein